MPHTPIKLTFYDHQTDEVIAEYSKSFIPYKMMKAANRLAKININDMNDEDADMIANFVVEAFGNKFTLKDCEEHVDLLDMFIVIQAIANRPSGLTSGNPTSPGM